MPLCWWWRCAAALLPSLMLAACAHAPVLEERSSSRAEEAIRAADRAGAAGEPLAAFHLRLARQELAQAQQGDLQVASRWLARAEADARLAAGRAEESRLRRRAGRARQGLEQLRRDEREALHQAIEERGAR